MIKNYTEFWLFYLQNHKKPLTRLFHVTGTLSALLIIAISFLYEEPYLILHAAFMGYLPAWFSHFFIEKNKPLTWKYPVWSLASDIRMTYLFFIHPQALE